VTKEELIIMLEKTITNQSKQIKLLKDKLKYNENDHNQLLNLRQKHDDLKIQDDKITLLYEDKIFRMKEKWDFKEKRYRKSISTLHGKIRKLKVK